MSDEWRELSPWPDVVRFYDTRTERIIEARLPSRHDGITRSGIGCGTGACVDELFAEDDPVEA